MTPATYRRLLDRLGLSIIGAAPVLGISKRQAQRIASDTPGKGSAISGPISKLVQLMVARGIDPRDVAALK